MRIVVNDIAASTGGARTILESFYNYVREFDKENEWIFLLGDDLLEETDTIRIKVLKNVKRSWLQRIFFDLVSGRRWVESLDADVFFSMQNTYTHGVSCPQVIYVHQALPFQQIKKFSFCRRDERKLALYQYVIGAIIRLSIRHADKVIVQTKWMRDTILENNLTRAEKIETIPPELDNLQNYYYYGEKDSGAFFYPTSEQAYKNNECISEACRLLRDQGVQSFNVQLTIAPPATAPKVQAIGRISRDQVLHILARSTLIFPSYVETYGLPLAEARALGSIVLAADLPYAREILSGYPNAYFFDPDLPDQLAELMNKVISGEIVKIENYRIMNSDHLQNWASVVAVLESAARKGNED